LPNIFLNCKEAGNIIIIQSYELLYENPVNSKNYYRLRQVDFDGQFKYTNIIQITFEQSNNLSIKIYPNPASDYIIIENIEVGKTVQIFNVNG
jgi:hypothetical protein